MSPRVLRTFLHVAGLCLAAVLLVFLPFSLIVNCAIVAVYWLTEGAMIEWIYNRQASLAERALDLRDRVDNSP